MADSKITALTALGAAPATGDLFVVVDISDTTMSANGTNKKVTAANLLSGLLTDTGTTTGATSQAQTFTNGIIGPTWKPASNSTTALQMTKADGTSILNVDTTNNRVGIGLVSPSVRFHVSGATQTDTLAVTSTATITTSTTTPILYGSSSSGGTLQISSTSHATKGATLINPNGGNVSIGTSSSLSKLYIHGTASSVTAGPHIHIVTDADSYPVFHALGYTHDNVALSWDAYFDAAGWKAGAATGAQWYKASGNFKLRYFNGATAGNAPSWNDSITLAVGTGALTFGGAVTASSTLDVASTATIGGVYVDADPGGVASTIGFSSVSDLSANSSGTGTVAMKGTTSRNSSGFIKIYIGVVAYYIPVWSAITG